MTGDGSAGEEAVRCFSRPVLGTGDFPTLQPIEQLKNRRFLSVANIDIDPFSLVPLTGTHRAKHGGPAPVQGGSLDDAVHHDDRDDGDVPKRIVLRGPEL